MSTSQNLILTVAGRQAAQFGSGASMTFESRGGSIGRADESDWVLGAPGVSRTHAVVRYLNGMYFIEDRSTNGMLLNGAPLAKGDPAALGDGDRLQLDTFEIEVRLQLAGAVSVVPAATQDLPAVLPTSAGGGDPFDIDRGWPAMPSPSQAPPGGGLLDDGFLAGIGVGHPASELDPLRMFDAAPEKPMSDASIGDMGWSHTSGAADHFQPPKTIELREAHALPENWDLTMGDFAPPAGAPAAVVEPPAVATPAPPSDAPLPPELARIFDIVVEGVMEVLRARAEIKNIFRLPVTIIQRSENNPLKFAATPEEAIQKIMAPTSAAFLSGTAAFDDAFDDIRCHQMAMLAGMRAAFESLLFHFSPDRFEQEVDGSGKRSAFAGKGRYWERYRENFEGLAKDPDECFRRLFGDEFARAYEAQLARLKTARRTAKR
ncbi:FHA domain protein [Luteibacter rhizovicinus]|uniref:FHA domain protein n=1 Tax=Luteibacter rhizovicinus TaxID=242606 RepID=A0A4R3YVJ4_9GAMM|nr:type VI secretion system-associated FHA domain protein TagH [Luteibacter rhizovicinus]TCV95838.1 FHA domain protein [Luteibacter rhizovicinus]